MVCLRKCASSFLFYLKNLIIADLLMTVTILLKTLSEASFAPRQLKIITCRYSSVVYYFTLYISIILMTLISLDRYLKIVRPFGTSFVRNKTFGKTAAVIIWVALFSTTAMPNMILTDPRRDNASGTLNCICLKEALGQDWHYAVIKINMVIFWVCFAVMVVFYLLISKEIYESYRRSQSNNKKDKRRAKTRVYVIIVVFFLCFAPYHFARIPYILKTPGRSCSLSKSLHLVKEFTLWLTSTNTCLDPLIYLYLCKSFRRRFIRTVSIRSSRPVKTNYSKGQEVSSNYYETSM
nr:PREDICTED: P2Y purinoceptor 13-like [Lepisosteus oculatus]